MKTRYNFKRSKYTYLTIAAETLSIIPPKIKIICMVKEFKNVNNKIRHIHGMKKKLSICRIQ